MEESVLLKSLRSTDTGSNVTAAVVKEYLARGEAELRKRHISGASGKEITSAYTHLVDTLLKDLFKSISEKLSGVEKHTALVAIGGYGRGELNISSDVDLMLLYKKSITPAIEDLTQRILYILWDAGLDVGFSIRSVNECIKLARDDLKTMTSLLDTRYLLGDKKLFNTLCDEIKKRLFNRKRLKAFIEEKMEENRQRHEKYGDSVYILEPNVREGEGGLRDVHTALWILKARFYGIGQPQLLTDKEMKLLKTSVDFLLWVRNEIHFETGRKTDQLTFDHQERVAAILGFEKTEHSLAVEAFMQNYYRHASNLSHLSSLMLSRLLKKPLRNRFFWPTRKFRIDKDYIITGGVLTVTENSAFKKDPVAIIRAFEYSQVFDVDIEQGTRDLILSNLTRVDDDFRNSTAAAESFIKILRGKKVFNTLSRMHELKFLERYIPEFEDITCKVQHDLYHIYTVDTHTLFAVRELERLKDHLKEDFPLLGTLCEEMENPEALMLGVLLHDIGKSLGKGHADKGAKLVPEICRRLGLSEDSTKLVRFLVGNHLLLADTAQYRDIHDEKLIIDFAKKIGDIERLNLLYLLTFADVRAVGPDIWNNWKGALFQELYFKALNVLERGSFEAVEAESKIEKVKGRVKKILPDIKAEEVDGYFELLPARYFLSNSPESIAVHIKTTRELKGRPYVMKVTQNRERQYTEIIVCTHDIHGLFSMITGVMAANFVNILGAQINTLTNGIALDILQVNTLYGEIITAESKLKEVEEDLSKILRGEAKLETIMGKMKPSILDKKAKPEVSTRIRIDNEVSDAYTVIEVHTQDMLGLLYTITSTLTRLGLYIHISKIYTKGGEASDIFYVRDIFGQKILSDERLKEIADTIYSAIEAKDNGYKKRTSAL
jgi:[protein-PII] uridylyltransferase